MAALHTAQWVKFFQQAGIPEKAAATYALTFAENRIQTNMLLDLNKEYLRDMGITLMGDVIAILRHARAKHDEIAREKLLVTSNGEKLAMSSKAVEVVPNNIPKSTVSVRKQTVSQMSDHYAREELSVVSAQPKPKVPSKDLNIHTDSTHPRKILVPQSEVVAPVKRKVKPTISALETITIEDDRPPKKVRRVSPEKEGGYKIRMPIGSTPRSQQILAKSKELARRQTVFQRLGSGITSTSSNGTRSPPSASAVSSTTGVNTPAFAVAGLSASVSKKVVKSETGLPFRSQSSSVFHRLGDKQVSSSTQSVVKQKEALSYAGILKSPDKYTHRIVQKPVEKITMVADSVETVRTEMRERLGAAPKASSTIFSYKVEHKSIADSSKVGIKARLGGSQLVSDKLEGESPVKERLKMTSVKSSAKVAPYSSANVSADKYKQKSHGVFSRLGL